MATQKANIKGKEIFFFFLPEQLSVYTMFDRVLKVLSPIKKLRKGLSHICFVKSLEVGWAENFLAPFILVTIHEFKKLLVLFDKLVLQRWLKNGIRHNYWVMLTGYYSQ